MRAATNRLQAPTSLRTANLRFKGRERQAMEMMTSACGAKIIEEWSQLAAPLLHADAYRSLLARARLLVLVEPAV